MPLLIEKVWVDMERVYAQATTGQVASYPFAMWERLKNATQQQREDFYLSYTGITGLKSTMISVLRGMFQHSGLCERTLTEDSVRYIG